MNEETGVKEGNKEGRNLLTQPLSAYSIPRWVVYVLGLIGLIYILNPTAGLLELIPDNLPFIGNLDEGVACVLLWAAIMEIVEGGKDPADEVIEEEPAE